MSDQPPYYPKVDGSPARFAARRTSTFVSDSEFLCWLAGTLPAQAPQNADRVRAIADRMEGK